MSADNNSDVLQHLVPCLLLTPPINTIIPREKPALYRMEMVCNDGVLLLGKCNRRTQKPNKLPRFSVYRPNIDQGTYLYLTWSTTFKLGINPQHSAGQNE